MLEVSWFKWNGILCSSQLLMYARMTPDDNPFKTKEKDLVSLACSDKKNPTHFWISGIYNHHVISASNNVLASHSAESREGSKLLLEWLQRRANAQP